MELSSNFGTFLLYGLSCVVCMVAYHKHPNFNFLKHMAIPVFGLVANLTCMAFYLVGPFMGYGTKMEPLIALGGGGGVGHLRRHLFHSLQQGEGANDAGQQTLQRGAILRLGEFHGIMRSGRAPKVRPFFI